MSHIQGYSPMEQASLYQKPHKPHSHKLPV
jgi:hypothetical protein